MFVQRLISGIFLLIAAFAAIWFGEWVLWAVCLFLSAMGMFEMFRVLSGGCKGIYKAGFVPILGYYLALMPLVMSEYSYSIALPVLAVGMIVVMSIYVNTFPRYKAADASNILFGNMYPGVMMSFLYLTRCLEGGKILVWLIFIAAWGSDTFAYCTGMLCKRFVGTHQMTPVLSPKKSVEGAVGGVFFATLLGVIYGIIFKSDISVFDIPVPVACGIVCFIGAFISMAGDLAASAVKRDREVKDYGKLIPGHGGVMDRFDSIVFTAPCVYFLCIILAIF